MAKTRALEIDAHIGKVPTIFHLFVVWQP